MYIDSCKAACEHLPTVKGLAQVALSFTWFFQDIPKLIRESNGKILVPFEKVFGQIKSIGTIFEMPEKWSAIFKQEKSYWNRNQNRLAALQVSLEGLLLIPHEWNWITLGSWMEPLTGMKDLLTIGASVCHIVAASQKLKRMATKVDRCQKNLKIRREIEATRRFNMAKVAALICHHALLWGVPGLRWGRCAANLATGLLGIDKMQLKIFSVVRK